MARVQGMKHSLADYGSSHQNQGNWLFTKPDSVHTGSVLCNSNSIWSLYQCFCTGWASTIKVSSGLCTLHPIHHRLCVNSTRSCSGLLRVSITWADPSPCIYQCLDIVYFVRTFGQKWHLEGSISSDARAVLICARPHHYVCAVMKLPTPSLIKVI